MFHLFLADVYLWEQEEFDANWFLTYFLFTSYGEKGTTSSFRTTLIYMILPKQSIYAIEFSLQVTSDPRQRLTSR